MFNKINRKIKGSKQVITGTAQYRAVTNQH